jgi:hypothetical protein
MRFAGGAGAIGGVRGRFVGTAMALIAFGSPPITYTCMKGKARVDFTLSN